MEDGTRDTNTPKSNVQHSTNKHSHARQTDDPKKYGPDLDRLRALDKTLDC